MKGQKIEIPELTKEQSEELELVRDVRDRLNLPIATGWSRENNSIMADDSTGDGMLYGREFYQRFLDDILTKKVRKKLAESDPPGVNTLEKLIKTAEKYGYVKEY